MNVLAQQKIISLLVRALVLFTAFPIHESAHALTAHWLGDDTAKNQGRISLNPFKHITWFGAAFMLFVGVGVANPVPINAGNFKNPKVGMAVSSLAGPLSNLILAYVSAVAYRITLGVIYYDGVYNAVVDILLYIFYYASMLNIGLAVFNLLPVPPLDGSRILTLFLPQDKYFGIMKYERYILAVIFVVMISGILDKPLMFLQDAVWKFMILCTDWVDIIRIIVGVN